ncbi:pre-peptidase C-terminal domain-containing protein [Lusitaniella coriacea LEGE 07157]|uniref:Pre-peptidase C-terminal domain-containing protein n=1 Tax=Lusitaniella coriacea LEGE 07157 TaxID=945747 RepID=A0A8J7E1J5_9CYAN|nr:CAP domain-containing protein [Lusitaniella coriacea]MBE9118557.1 pre-peptidase C-terminal domain-containing protein [Lusitaniella coriacea LEGE 07157]
MNPVKFCFIVALMGTILPLPARAALFWGGDEERPSFTLAQNAISPLERQILQEMNRARANPSAYADWLEQTKQYYQGNILQFPGQPPIGTQEGVRVVDEAIRFLRGLPPLPPLSLSLGMSRGVKDHVGDLGTKGAVGHYGSDGSQFIDRIGRYGTASGAAGENITYGVTTAQAVVMQLIVDDGVEGRIHRDNIFYEGFRVAGVACGQHLRYEQMCAIAYSGDYVDRVAQTPPPVAPINPARISSSSNNSPVVEVETQPSSSVSNNPPVAEVETQSSPSVSALVPPASLQVGTPPPLPQATPVPPPTSLTPPTPPPATIQAETRRLSPPPAISPQTATPAETTPPSLPPTNSSAAALIAPSPPQNAVGTTPTPTLPSINNNASQPPAERIVGTTPTPTLPSINNNAPQPPAERIVGTTPTPTLPSGNNNAPPETSGEVAVGTPTTPPPQTAAKTILREQGLLEDGDLVYERDGSLYDVHVFQGSAGQSVTITVESGDFDTFLAVFDEKDDIVGQNDDISDEITNSALTIALPQDGTYRIFINGYDARDRGGYTLTVIE